jgi:uncharacterized protein
LIEKYYIFYILAFFAEILGTISGFGSSILFVPIASLFFDFHLILGITAIFHVFSNLSKIMLFRNGIDKRIVLKLGIPAVIFVILGAWMNKFFPQGQMELLLSIVLIGLSVYLLIYSTKNLEQNSRNLIAGGAASGFVAGFVGTGGAIRGIVLAAFNLEKDVFISTSAFIDMGVDSSRAVVYYLNGYLGQEVLVLLPALILISIAGTWIGKKLLRYIPQKQFIWLVIGVVITTSLVQLVNYLVGKG